MDKLTILEKIRLVIAMVIMPQRMRIWIKKLVDKDISKLYGKTN